MGQRKTTTEVAAQLFDRSIHGVRCLLTNQLFDIDETEDEHRAGHGDNIAAVLFACRKLLVTHAPETARRHWLADYQQIEAALLGDNTTLKGLKWERKRYARVAKKAQEYVDRLLSSRTEKPADPPKRKTRK